MKEKQALLTVNGKPMAILLSVDSESADDTMLTLQRLRAQQALQAIRQDARKKGLDRLSMDQITALVDKTRLDRRRAER